MVKYKISYRKLRILLMDRKLQITNVCKAIGLSGNVGTNITRDKNINIESLRLICEYLEVGIEDVVEFVDDKK